ncbi:hypothetical protein HN615_02175 [Candidatus Woesearchaeota archaeon]|jgi:hypothetical protein|nr:hypothetical protein [Candidatus Woesearchaeota archaeon]MBT7555718.1 hypothetical protein [Candidatus Woesearchaeota archaeon]
MKREDFEKKNHEFYLTITLLLSVAMLFSSDLSLITGMNSYEGINSVCGKNCVEGEISGITAASTTFGTGDIPDAINSVLNSLTAAIGVAKGSADCPEECPLKKLGESDSSVFVNVLETEGGTCKDESTIQLDYSETGSGKTENDARMDAIDELLKTIYYDGRSKICSSDCSAVTELLSSSFTCGEKSGIFGKKWVCKADVKIKITCGDKATKEAGKSVIVSGKWNYCWNCMKEKPKQPTT